MANKNLGDLLLEQGAIGRRELEQALGAQGRRLGQILVDENLADPVAVVSALKEQARSANGPQELRRELRASISSRQVEELLELADQLGDLERVESDRSFRRKKASLHRLRSYVENLLISPADKFLQRISAVVMRAAIDLNKDVSVQTSGNSLGVDRFLLEELYEAALHLGRNAMVHGIESPGVRRDLGKASSGTVRILLSQKHGQLTLSVEDDGAGLDEENILAQAVERGFCPRVPSAPAMRKELIQKMLFTPGFSTAASKTNYAGRGIGLDVVEASALRLGGEVEFSSEKGRGTRFSITVPLSSVILPVVPLRYGDSWVGLTADSFSDCPAPPSGSQVRRLDAPVSSIHKPKAVHLRTLKGGVWEFDEVGVRENCLVRTPSLTESIHDGVVGSCRTSSGLSLLVLDLDLLEKKPAGAG